MRLVGMLDSPYVRRVAIAMLSGGVAFRHDPLSLFRHIDAFSALSPLLKAPSLLTDEGIVLVESGVILNYLAGLSPKIEAMRAKDLASSRAEGVALTICEKAVQVHYERALRKEGERSESWIARVRSQLAIGLAALETDIPAAGWIGGAEIGLADVTVAVAFGFTRDMIGDTFDTSAHARLAAFAARAESLPAFKAAPAIDGAQAPVG